nr:MAG TPA: hypothetical protein [Caudoviricetes sp.]
MISSLHILWICTFGFSRWKRNGNGKNKNEPIKNNLTAWWGYFFVEIFKNEQVSK